MMNKLNIIKHWKTSVSGVLIGSFTIMFWLGKISVDELVTLMGIAGTALGLISKDWDKPSD